MLWIKAWHLIFMVAWFAGLFYLPRLFVYHAEAQDELSRQRFKIMEQRLYYYIMTPAAILTVLFGLALLVIGWPYYKLLGWVHAKLFLVFLLLVFHAYCGCLLRSFQKNCNRHSAKFYRFFNEIPTLLLISIVILAVVQPF